MKQPGLHRRVPTFIKTNIVGEVYFMEKLSLERCSFSTCGCNGIEGIPFFHTRLAKDNIYPCDITPRKDMAGGFLAKDS